MSEGCQHRESKIKLACNKVCDPGRTLCPHHLLLAQAETPDAAAKKRPQKVNATAHQTPRAYSE